MPAGRPCRVMTISSAAACRRYFDRSSFTAARATCRGASRRCLFVEPGVRFGLRDDGEDLDLRLCNVIKHPDVVNAQPILRLAEPPKALDTALADLRRFVGQMHADGLDDASAHWHR